MIRLDGSLAPPGLDTTDVVLIAEERELAVDGVLLAGECELTGCCLLRVRSGSGGTIKPYFWLQ